MKTSRSSRGVMQGHVRVVPLVAGVVGMKTSRSSRGVMHRTRYGLTNPGLKFLSEARTYPVRQAEAHHMRAERARFPA